MMRVPVRCAAVPALRADPMVALALGLFVAACAGASSQPATPIVPGTIDHPREVNLIARDYAFVPASLDLVPGESIVLHVVNAGLVVHEAVIGGASVQDAWETAEEAMAGAPPGPTPLVSVPPDVAGIRLVVRSGERVDLNWTVPGDAAGGTGDPKGDTASGSTWVVGCHIPGHWAKGMQVPVRWIQPTSDGVAPATAP